jgi:enoyl-CoA hydratase/carnithine racemase
MTRYETGTSQLLAEVSDGVALLTFNNPAKRNALTRDMRAALPGVLGGLGTDEAVRVVVVTGAGDKAFTAGADISEFPELRTSAAARAEYDRARAAVGDAWAHLEKPVIAMIRGFCLGGGLMLALQADIRIAAEGSQFGIPAARLGLGFGYGAVTTLMSLIGPARTAEVLFSARRFPAAEARQMGLVNRVVPADRLEADVMSLAQDIAQNAPLTVAAAKAAIRQAAQAPGQPATAQVQAMIEACFQSADYREGQRAFAEKRPPAFTGR